MYVCMYEENGIGQSLKETNIRITTSPLHRDNNYTGNESREERSHADWKVIWKNLTLTPTSGAE